MGDGSMTYDGCNLVWKLAYAEAGYSKIDRAFVGTGQNDPTVADSNMTPDDGSASNTAVERVPAVCTLISDCSAVLPWVKGGQADDDALNTTDFREGYQTDDMTALSMGKDGGAGVDAYYDFTFGASVDMSDSYLYLQLYIDDADTLADLDVTDACQIWAGTGGIINYDYWTFARTDLAIGWNLLCCTIEDSDGTGGAGLTTNAVDNLRIRFATTNAGDTIAVGKLVMDFWHYASETDFTVNFDAGFPTYQTGNREVTDKWKLPSTDALGYNLGEVGEFNNDTTKVMQRRDTHDQQIHSSKDEVFYSNDNRINPA